MSQELHDNLWVLIAGFILTTVAGGLLASILQARLWRHQWKAERRVKFEEAARAVFEDVSRLMDKRLFRLSQWRLWIARGDEPRIAIALEDYRAVMREWNAALNVDCVFCHKGQVGKPWSTFDFTDDSKQRHEVARLMVQQTMHLNEQFKDLGEMDQPTKVTCATCHRRSRHPEIELPPAAPKAEK